MNPETKAGLATLFTLGLAAFVWYMFVHFPAILGLIFMGVAALMAIIVVPLVVFWVWLAVFETGLPD